MGSLRTLSSKGVTEAGRQAPHPAVTQKVAHNRLQTAGPAPLPRPPGLHCTRQILLRLTEAITEKTAVSQALGYDMHLAPLVLTALCKAEDCVHLFSGPPPGLAAQLVPDSCESYC